MPGWRVGDCCFSYATTSRPLQPLARVEEAAGSTLVPKPSEGLVRADDSRCGCSQNPNMYMQLSLIAAVCTSRDALAETKSLD